MSSFAKFFGSLGIVVLVLAGLDLPSASAQGTRETGPTPVADSGATRFGFGFSAGSMGGGEDGIAVRLGYTISRFENRSALITIRSSGVEEFELFGPSPAENVWDIGVLYGRQSRGKWGYASASAGLAIVSAFANVNPERTLTGASLSVIVGKLR